MSLEADERQYLIDRILFLALSRSRLSGGLPAGSASFDPSSIRLEGWRPGSLALAELVMLVNLHRAADAVETSLLPSLQPAREPRLDVTVTNPVGTLQGGIVDWSQTLSKWSEGEAVFVCRSIGWHPIPDVQNLVGVILGEFAGLSEAICDRIDARGLDDGLRLLSSRVRTRAESVATAEPRDRWSRSAFEDQKKMTRRQAATLMDQGLAHHEFVRAYHLACPLSDQSRIETTGLRRLRQWREEYLTSTPQFLEHFGYHVAVDTGDDELFALWTFAEFHGTSVETGRVDLTRTTRLCDEALPLRRRRSPAPEDGKPPPHPLYDPSRPPSADWRIERSRWSPASSVIARAEDQSGATVRVLLGQMTLDETRTGIYFHRDDASSCPGSEAFGIHEDLEVYMVSMIPNAASEDANREQLGSLLQWLGERSFVDRQA